MASPSPEQILEALRPIEDPDFKRSIVELGFIKDLEIDGGRVAFKIELTTPACPVKEQFREAASRAVSALPGVDRVEVEMTANTRATPQAPDAPEGLAGVKNIIAVASGKGGVGKSTVSVNLAFGLQQSGARVGLLDCDVYGPSVPLMTAASGKPAVSADRKIMPLDVNGVRLMSIGFLAGEDAPVIWRGPMVHGIIRQFLSDVDWGELDYLVLDMPPGTGDAALTVTQTAPLAGAVIVTTPQEVSLIDARKGLQMFRRVNVPVLGIVENMSYFVPPDLPDRRYNIFGEGGGERASQELGVPLLVQIPIQPDVVEAGDSGKPTIVANPGSPAGEAFALLVGSVARKVALLHVDAPPVLGGNIEWVNTPG
jgi:ATP-binding protein involved in chromosome partitioning